MLVLGDAPPFSVEALREKASTILAQDDLAEFDCVAAGAIAQGLSLFSKVWHRSETQIKNETARVRATRRSVEVQPYLKEHEGYSMAIAHGVADAYARSNPAERELFLDRLRWSLLDDIATQDSFGLSAVLVYVVKLQLAARWVQMEPDTGREQFEQILLAQLKKDDPTEIVEPEDNPSAGREPA